MWPWLCTAHSVLEPLGLGGSVDLAKSVRWSKKSEIYHSDLEVLHLGTHTHVLLSFASDIEIRVLGSAGVYGKCRPNIFCVECVPYQCIYYWAMAAASLALGRPLTMAFDPLREGGRDSCDRQMACRGEIWVRFLASGLHECFSQSSTGQPRKRADR